MRDEINGQELRYQIEQNKADAIRIKPQLSTGARADMFGETLGQMLHLCIGARVMVTHNLCVALGLVNGTRGIVHDIIVRGPDQVPTAVLLKVQRRTATQDGYSGPCFLRGELANDDPATEVRSLLLPLTQQHASPRYNCSGVSGTGGSGHPALPAGILRSRQKPVGSLRTCFPTTL
jgi:hypothetical protein